MNFDIQDQEIKNTFSKVRVNRIPERYLNNYEQDVMLKVRASESTSIIGIPAMALGVAAILLIACIWFFYNRPVVDVQKVKQEHSTNTIESKIFQRHNAVSSVSREIVQSETPKKIAVDAVNALIVKPEVENTKFEKIEREMFILEILGEDEGLMDDFDHVAGDMDLLSKISPSVA